MKTHVYYEVHQAPRQPSPRKSRSKGGAGVEDPFIETDNPDWADLYEKIAL